MKARIVSFVSLVILMACGSPNESALAEQASEPMATVTKFVIKASNNQYVSIDPTKYTLTANQPKAELAEVFEVVNLDKGKIALKINTGKYVCADQSKNMYVVADREYAGEWETFEMIKMDQSKVNFKAFNGKFFSADHGAGGIVMANRDVVSDWETFIVEPR